MRQKLGPGSVPAGSEPILYTYLSEPMVQMPATSSSGQDFYDLPRLLHFEVDRF